MQLGFVGLGKMGGNMVHRIHRDSDHQVVAFDFNADAVDDGRGPRRDRRRARSRTSSSKLEAPRMVWLMVPAGDPTEQTVDAARRAARRRATRSSTAATPTGTTTCAAPRELDAQGIHYVDVGTSGGVWGLEVGYCMMVGGHEESVAAARADPRRARPAGRLAPLRRRRRRALREDGPQRRRVRDDAGLRRGLRAHAQVEVPDRAQGGRGPVEPRLGRPLLAVRAGRAARSSEEGNDLESLRRLRRRLRRGPLDDRSTASTSTCRRR